MENQKSFIKRMWIYQKERFPLFVNLIAVCTFTFSAISYSRIFRNETGFVDWSTYLIGCFATFTLFFLVRIFDEFKDQEDDRKYRSYLPVPRGLVSLKELKIVAIVLVIIQVTLIAVFQLPMILFYVIVLAYLVLMGVEFFVPEWLKKRQVLYLISHMMIIPLLDIYSSGLDWYLEGAEPHWGLLFFFFISFLNGILGEFGRKIKTPEMEEEGVNSYTKSYGIKKAVIIWISVLILSLIVATIGAYLAGFGLVTMLILILLSVICLLIGFRFMFAPTKKLAKMMELVSGIWIIGMYLTLGAVPMIINLINA